MMTSLVEAIGHARHCPTVCLTADKAQAWFAERVEALLEEYDVSELDGYWECLPEDVWRFARDLRALLGDA